MLQGRAHAHPYKESSASNVLIKYLVPPPVQKEFIEVFRSVKEGWGHTTDMLICLFRM